MCNTFKLHGVVFTPFNNVAQDELLLIEQVNNLDFICQHKELSDYHILSLYKLHYSLYVVPKWLMKRVSLETLNA